MASTGLGAVACGDDTSPGDTSSGGAGGGDTTSTTTSTSSAGGAGGEGGQGGEGGGTVQVCTPNETRCADEGVETCLPDGSGFGAAVACEGATPACFDGACVACDPGTSICADDGSTQSCLPDGSGYATAVACEGATPACLDGECVTCLPNTVTCADDGSTQTCLGDGSGYAAAVACDVATPVCVEGSCLVCVPGDVRCADDATVETCAMDGSGYEVSDTCENTEACSVDACVPLCELAEADPSSEGCSFVTVKLDSFYTNVGNPTQHDALIVLNPYADRTVDVQLFLVANDATSEVAVGSPVTLAAGGSTTFLLSNPEVDSLTLLRSGGVYRVASTIPVAAFHHTPQSAAGVNDSMLLLPESTLGGEYVVASYPSTGGAYPSYFTAVGLVDGTMLSFTPPQGTAAGAGVAAVAPGGTGMVSMDRFSFLNVVAATQNGGDLSGTIVSANQPFWLVGATECANVPNNGVTFCDVLSEQLIPLQYWGTEYAAARAPTRGSEDFHWRVYAGADNVTVSANPAQPGFPATLDKGAFVQLQTLDHVVFTANGPILPVQYLEGQNGGAGTGDPAMVQAIPTTQFVTSAIFVTGSGFATNYAQIVRPVGGAEVFVDGVAVAGYTAFGNYEVANVTVADGVHRATSANPFGIYAYGYNAIASYASPAAMRLTMP